MEREDEQEPKRRTEPGRKQDRRRLPVELTGLLPRKLEHGLDHVARRRILRVLHKEKREFSPAQLSREGEFGDGLSVSVVAYHVNVLAKFGMVSEVRTAPNRGALEHFYVSAVDDDMRVLSVLARTKELDASERDFGGEG
jgi:DNA-binding transcriptional ArsR family regulator